MLKPRLRAHRGGSREAVDGTRTPHVLAATVLGGVLAGAGVAAGITAALAATPDRAATVQEADAPPEAALQVTLVQRVMQPVVIRSVRDPRSHLSANGRDLWAVSSEGSFDVPSAALRAYQHAADEVDRVRPSCQMPWTLLAGIGRVESDHGRYGGSQLGTDGLPRPAIVGIALDGQGPVAAIHDSDGGRWDGDTVWDRAVGPMQFIPGTWRSSGRDGDGDGVRNPNDIDDAALAAAYYLCPSSGSIRSDAAMDAAIRSYNNSAYYVDLVEAFAHGYETGVFVIPSPPAAPGVGADAPKVKPAVTKVDKHGKPVTSRPAKHGTKHATKHAPSGGAHSSSGGSSGGSHTGTAGGSRPGGSTGSGGSTPAPTHTPTPSPTPTPTATPTPTTTLLKGTLTETGGVYSVSGAGRVLDWRFGEGDAAAAKRARLDALVGTPVTVRLQGDVVLELDGQAW